MKIAQINERYALVGGSEKTMRRCAAGLRDAGHDVLIIHGDAEAASQAGAAFVPSVNWATPFRSAKARRDILRVLADFGADVVHFRNFNGPGVIRAVARRYPTVRTVHTPWTYCPTGIKYWLHSGAVCDRPFGVACLARHRHRGCDLREDGTVIGRLEMARRLAACYAFRDADARLRAVVVTSRWMKEMFAAAGQRRDKIHIIPPPVDIPPELATADNGGAPEVIAVGRIERIKGFDRLLSAMALLPPEISLTLVGDGPQLTALKKLAGKLGLGGRVTFAGWVPYRELSVIYRRARLLVLPSVWPEAFGNVGVEALSYGTPVVAYRVGGVAEWLEDGQFGLLAQPGDVGDLAAKISWLLSQPDAARAMGAAGRRAVREYSLARHVAKTVEVYEKAAVTAAAGGRMACLKDQRKRPNLLLNKRIRPANSAAAATQHLHRVS